MEIQTQIRQQQATVQMLEKLLRARRSSQADVDQAKRRLADLQEQVGFKPIVPAPLTAVRVDPEPPSGRQVDDAEYVSLQAELPKEADRLNRQMADLSNKLHQVPPGVNCSELIKPILDLKSQIEAVWNKKRYLERNKSLPQEAPADEPPTERAERSPEKYALAYEKRRLVDLRSKLKRKLDDPKARPSKRVEWETELTRANLQISELDVMLGCT